MAATARRSRGASPLRRLLAVALTALMALLTAGLTAGLTVGVTAGAAQAATGYRYWNYFHVQNGKYVFAKSGAGDYTPKNGAVEAYRYGTSTASKGLPPRADLGKYDFGSICAGTKAAAGQKRVAVILDYGTKADAPDGQAPPAPRTACAAVPSTANGQQVLDSVSQVRQHPYTCGIDGYPATGCSVTVKNAHESTGRPVPFALPKAAQAAGGKSATSPGARPGASPAASSGASGGTGPWPWVALAVICLALVLGAYRMNRRRSR